MKCHCGTELDVNKADTKLVYYVTEDGTMSKTRARKPVKLVCPKCGSTFEWGYGANKTPPAPIP